MCTSDELVICLRIHDEEEQKRAEVFQSLLNGPAAASLVNMQCQPDLELATTTRRSINNSTFPEWPARIPNRPGSLSMPDLEALGLMPATDGDGERLFIAIRPIDEALSTPRHNTKTLIRHTPEALQERDCMILGDLVPRPYALTMQRLKELDSTLPNPERFLKPHFWGMIPTNRGGTKSVRSMQSGQTEESEDGIQYTVKVRLKDRDNKIWILEALVDTGAERSFISGWVLSKIGQFKERPLPEEKRKVFTSPIGDTTTEPESFIDVELEFEIAEIESMRAKLRIMAGTDKFEVILGRDFTTKYRRRTNTSLLELLEQADQPNSSSTGMNGVFAIRPVKKTPAQIAADEEYKRKIARDRQALKNLQNARTKAPAESARVPMRDTTREGFDTPNRSTVSRRNVDFRLSSRENLESDDFNWQSRRTVRTDTSSTQCSSIFERGSIASSSSMSSEASSRTLDETNKNTSSIDHGGEAVCTNIVKI